MTRLLALILFASGAAGGAPIPSTEVLPCDEKNRFRVSYLPAVAELGLIEWEDEYAAFAGNWRMKKGAPSEASLPRINRAKLWCEKAKMVCTEAIAMLHPSQESDPTNALSLRVLKYRVTKWTKTRIEARHFGGATENTLELDRKKGALKKITGERAGIGGKGASVVYALE